LISDTIYCSTLSLSISGKIAPGAPLSGNLEVAHYIFSELIIIKENVENHTPPL